MNNYCDEIIENPAGRPIDSDVMDDSPSKIIDDENIYQDCHKPTSPSEQMNEEYELNPFSTNGGLHSVNIEKESVYTAS